MNEYPDRKSAIFAAEEHRRIIRNWDCIFIYRSVNTNAHIVIFIPVTITA